MLFIGIHIGTYMAIVARGMPITEAYRDYKSGKFIVNRKYQRKLVWSVAEKQKLIDSILNGYPIPLILLAQTKDSKYEVIDIYILQTQK